jgi:hypothetical protein
MSTKWVVTTPSDHVELDEAQQGQTTFTVTNPTAKVDRVAFDIVPQDGADPSWFTVDEPQRRVPAGGSVSYVMKTAIPDTAKPGSYSVQGRAYSADSAPEEDSVLSGRVAVEVKPKAGPAPRKRFPWWIVVVAALVVIVLVVVAILVFSGGGKPEAKPSTPPPVGEQVTMPDLSNQSTQQARTNIGAFGLSVGTVRYKVDNVPNRVLYQSVPGGAKVTRGTPVNLVVTATLVAPVITTPAQSGIVKAAAVAPPVTPVPVNPPAAASGAPAPGPPAPAKAPDVIVWTDSDSFVSHWLVTIQQQMCVSVPFYGRICSSNEFTTVVTRVDRPSYTPILPPASSFNKLPAFYLESTNVFTVAVQAVDDFGNTGPYALSRTFVVL